jgi:hypothetical protein
MNETVENEIPPNPTSAQALKRYADTIHGMDMPEHCCMLLAPFLKGALGLATSKALAK